MLLLLVCPLESMPSQTSLCVASLVGPRAFRTRHSTALQLCKCVACVPGRRGGVSVLAGVNDSALIPLSIASLQHGHRISWPHSAARPMRERCDGFCMWILIRLCWTSSTVPWNCVPQKQLPTCSRVPLTTKRMNVSRFVVTATAHCRCRRCRTFSRS